MSFEAWWRRFVEDLQKSNNALNAGWLTLPTPVSDWLNSVFAQRSLVDGAAARAGWSVVNLESPDPRQGPVGPQKSVKISFLSRRQFEDD